MVDDKTLDEWEGAARRGCRDFCKPNCKSNTCEDYKIKTLITALKEAKQVIEKNAAYFRDRIQEHREYDMLDMNNAWLEKWDKEENE